MAFTIYLSSLWHSTIFMLMVITINHLGFNTVTAQGMDHLKNCRGVDLDLVEKNTIHINQCLQEAGLKEIMNMETSQMACFAKCVMMKRGIINDKGLPLIENIKKMIVEDLPAIVHEELNKEADNCFNDESRMIDPSDESCTTYIPLGMCIHGAFLEVCQ